MSAPDLPVVEDTAWWKAAAQELADGRQDAVDDIGRKLDTWTSDFRALQRMNDLNRFHEEPDLDHAMYAQSLIYLEDIKGALELLQAYAERRKPSESVLGRMAEVTYMYQRCEAIELKIDMDRRLLNADSDPTVLPSKSESGDLKARPDMFITAPQTSNTGDKYQAPKMFAMEFTKDAESSRARQEEEEDTYAERINKSEFVKAVTELYLPTPQIRDDGAAELDYKTHKKLASLKKIETDQLENFGVRRHTTKGMDKKYRELQTKQNLLGVGSSLKDLDQFVDRLDNKKQGPAKTKKASKPADAAFLGQEAGEDRGARRPSSKKVFRMKTKGSADAKKKRFKK